MRNKQAFETLPHNRTFRHVGSFFGHVDEGCLSLVDLVTSLCLLFCLKRDLSRSHGMGIWIRVRFCFPLFYSPF